MDALALVNCENGNCGGADLQADLLMGSGGLRPVWSCVGCGSWLELER